MNSKEKISSQEIVDLVSAKASVSKRAAEEFLKMMISTIEDALLAGESVKIKGFGTFKLQWNEPRKSVNVQTGEDIVIEGYYKVSFAPDSSLKDLVNEPFAHLEPVTLDEDGEPKMDVANDSEEEIPEPLRMFTEQAFEIKNILSEINALSADSNDNDEGDVNDQDDFHYEIDTFEDDEDDEEPESLIEEVVEEVTESQIVETVEDEPEIVEEPTEIKPEEENKVEPEYAESSSKEDESIVETNIPQQETVLHPDNSAIENDSSAFLEKAKPVRKKKRWLIPVILLVIIGIAAVLYFVYPPVTDFGNGTYANVKDNVSKWLTTEDKNSGEIETVVVPKDTAEVDSLVTEPVKDSLQILFDTPRVYPEFIASATITKGSRLAWLSKKYYGLSDFWVYIYEANRDRFDDPDKIPEGALIHVPKLDPRLIDAFNPRCVENAKKLHDLYVKR